MLMMKKSIVLCAVVVSGFQAGLGTLKLTPAAFETAVKGYVEREVAESDGAAALPFLPMAARPGLLALDDAGRAALVRELALAGKALVMSPAFEAAYREKIRQQYNAVDHGLKVVDIRDAMKAKSDDEAVQKMQTMVRDQLRQSVLGQVKESKNFNGDTLEMLAETVPGMFDVVEPANAAEKAMRSRGLALLKEAQKLAKTDLAAAKEKFRQGSLLGVFIDPANESGAAADSAKTEQQRNYNQRAFRPRLKAKLLDFVQQAKTVDFKAATTARGTKKVFVNAAYEQKSPLWKALYRLGPGGTGAAVAVAQAWAAEL